MSQVRRGSGRGRSSLAPPGQGRPLVPGRALVHLLGKAYTARVKVTRPFPAPARRAGARVLQPAQKNHEVFGSWRGSAASTCDGIPPGTLLAHAGVRRSVGGRASTGGGGRGTGSPLWL